MLGLDRCGWATLASVGVAPTPGCKKPPRDPTDLAHLGTAAVESNSAGQRASSKDAEEARAVALSSDGSQDPLSM